MCSSDLPVVIHNHLNMQTQARACSYGFFKTENTKIYEKITVVREVKVDPTRKRLFLLILSKLKQCHECIFQVKMENKSAKRVFVVLES